MYVTSDRLEVKENPSSESLKIATLNNNEEIKNTRNKRTMV